MATIEQYIQGVEGLLKSNSMLINTGNIINLNELKRKTSQEPTDELIESLSLTLSKWASKQHDIEIEESMVICRPGETKCEIVTENRKELKITVKIFLPETNSELLKSALDEVLQELGLDFVELVILAVPPETDIETLWGTLEEYVRSKKVLTAGVSDLDTEKLKALHAAAKIKPIVNHINLNSCCVMPPEMTVFAKDNDIQLLTHSDSADILPQSEVPRIFQHIASSKNWKVHWVARYSAMIKCRGVIQNKGYLAKLNRQTIS